MLRIGANIVCLLMILTGACCCLTAWTSRTSCSPLSCRRVLNGFGDERSASLE